MDAPTLYAFAPGTGELLASFQADPDPEGDGFLIPWGATDKVPPKVPAGEAAVWASEGWSLRPNHRGETWYDADGRAVMIEQLGDPAAFDPPLSATAPAGPPPDMPALRQAAFEAAMAYGNGITARVTGTYSDVEARTWPLQRAQADTVLHGGELPADALLRKLAARREMDLEAFALLVQHKAEAFETIADVGQGLRLGAEGLLAEAIDTPEKLDAAVEALRAQVLAAAGGLGLTV